MKQGGRIKDWWVARSRRWRVIVDWMNQVAAFLNRIEVVRPLVMTKNNGSIQIAWYPPDAVLPHPWRISASNDGTGWEYTVDGGRVHDGLSWVEVAGIAETALTADLCVWLKVKYWNSSTSTPIYQVVADTEFPESDWEADVLPGADPMVLPKSGWVETIIPIGLISAAGVVTQYLYEDQVLPFGLTYSAPRAIAYRYDVATETVQAIQVVETFVRGELRSMTAPLAVDLMATTNNCP